MSLSPYNPGHVFVEYTDGSIYYWLPKTWHDAVRTVHEASNIAQRASNSAISQGDALQGFTSYVAEEIGKDVAEEIGAQIISSLVQGGE
jgi:hypothetical protein